MNLKEKIFDDLTQNEIVFHRMIAENTRNPILILILDFVENLLEDFKKVLKPDLEFSKSVLYAHEKIYQAIDDKDPVKAHDEMYRHVDEVGRNLIKLKSDIDLWRGCLKTGS
jgi:GntR family transcriptional repressor for pyruvate dehydrogenase complex